MLIFDATNSSAARWADFARAHLPMGMPVIGWDDADLASLGLVGADRAMGMWWIGSDGVPRGGPRAAVALTRAAGGWRAVAAPALRVPGVSGAAARLIPRSEERAP